MLTFIPHSIAGKIELLTPSEAADVIATAKLGCDFEPASDADPEIGELCAAIFLTLHDRAKNGKLMVLTQRLGDDVIYRVQVGFWKDYSELDGGFCLTNLFFLGNYADPRFDNAPVYYARADIDRLATDDAALAHLPLPTGVSAQRPAIDSATRDAECKRVAALLDAEGVSIRAVNTGTIERHWDLSKGSQPKIGAVTGFMVGGIRGRQKKRRAA